MGSGIVNGRDYDFACIEAKVGTTTYPICAIGYGDPREIGKVFGNSSKKRGRTRGQVDATGSFEMFFADARDFLKAMTTEFGGYYEGDFPVTVSYGNNGQPVVTDKLFDVCLTDVQDDHGEGTDALKTSFEMDIMTIKRDGSQAFADD